MLSVGMRSALDSRHRLAIPDTPPELVSPDSALSTITRQQFEDRFWSTATVPISPPMSNYDPASKTDLSSGKGPDEVTAARTEPAKDASAPRTQLPSLSSLFGPSHMRPLHSPTLDNSAPFASPAYTSGGLDRSFSSSSYFTSTPGSAAPPPPNRNSPYDSRLDERPTIPSLSRHFLGPPSPRPREPEPPRTELRHESASHARWSATQSESGRSPFHSPQSRMQPLMGPRRDDEYTGVYGEQQQRTPQASGHVLPSTPGSNSHPEVPTVKDGLGPKIWTGTHFLPRFVRSAEMPGEGLCYFYDDGSHCRSVIDGEVVNAHWGVTKAGKPRKRLAIACITCREKKIKCDPDYPRCVQCEKFGRVCKFKNAPRGGHNTSPSTPPAETDDVRRLEPMLRPPPVQPRPANHVSDPISPRSSIRPGSPLDTGLPMKRMRLGFDHYGSPAGGAGPRSPLHAPTPDTARSSANGGFPWPQPERPRIRDDVLCRAWQTDPYVSNPQSVVNTVSSFFVHTDGTALRFLPAVVVKSWIQSAHRKSPEDLMLVYSILATGAALSGSANIAHEYAQVARYAVDRAPLTLQLVQGKLLLALYYLATSRPGEANDMLSGAVSAATCLQLNLELDKVQDGNLKTFPYGLQRAGYAEVRRRTFWACFLLERVNGLFPTRVAIINPEDIFLRLPADMASFESQSEVFTHFFEPVFSASRYQNSGMGMGIMGHLVQVVTVFGDVMASIYRHSHRNSHMNIDLGHFHRQILNRLQDWRASLPAHMNFSASNLELIGQDRGSFILMHLTYHLTIIKLHRHVHPASLAAVGGRAKYASVARDHARKLLDAVCTIARDRSVGSTHVPPPFTSFAILEATDVLSSSGSFSELAELIDGLALARSVLELLGTVWEDAKVHRMAMDHRLDRLSTLRESTGPEGSGTTSPIPGVRIFTNQDAVDRDRQLEAGPCWEMVDALETRFLQMDTIYSATTAAA